MLAKGLAPSRGRGHACSAHEKAKLWKFDAAAAVGVDRLDHLLYLVVARVGAERSHHRPQLRGINVSTSIQVKERKGLL